MRKLLFIFGLLLSLTSSAQFNLSSGITIQVACGITAATSSDVSNVQRMIQAKNYASLKQSLYSFSQAEVVLSIIALQTLESKGVITLTPEESKRIKEVSSWTDRFFICHTCSQHLESTVNDLLTKKSSVAYQFLAAALFKSI
ncbi:MAG TPA: hypothetical protein VGB56_05620 [Flavisolibacter sp.]|jgi:hypothetical protein